MMDLSEDLNAYDGYYPCFLATHTRPVLHIVGHLHIILAVTDFYLLDVLQSDDNTVVRLGNYS